MNYYCPYCSNYTPITTPILAGGLSMTCIHCKNEVMILLHPVNSEFFGLTDRLKKILLQGGITTLTQLLEQKDTLTSIKGIGEKSLTEIDNFFESMGIEKTPSLFEGFLNSGDVLVICGNTRIDTGIKLMRAAVLAESFLGFLCTKQNEVFYITDDKTPLLNYSFNESEITQMNEHLILLDGISDDSISKFLALLSRPINLICLDINGFVENQKHLLSNLKTECLKFRTVGVIIINTPSAWLIDNANSVIFCEDTELKLYKDNQLTVFSNGETVE